MAQLLSYRQRLVDRCLSVGQEIQHILEAFPEAALHTIQDDETDWSVHRIAAHVRDVEALVFLPSIQLLLQDPAFQDSPPSLTDFQRLQRMAPHYQPDEPLVSILSDFLTLIEKKMASLHTMPPDGWNRLGRHPTWGLHTLQWWIEHSVGHMEEHLAQLRRMQGKADV